MSIIITAIVGLIVGYLIGHDKGYVDCIQYLRMRGFTYEELEK